MWVGGSDLGSAERGGDAAVEVSSGAALRAASAWSAARVEATVRELERFAVDVVVARHALPDPAGALLERAGVLAVQCAPRVECAALCRRAGVSPVVAESPAAMARALAAGGAAPRCADGRGDAARLPVAVVGRAASVRAWRAGGLSGTLFEGIIVDGGGGEVDAGSSSARRSPDVAAARRCAAIADGAPTFVPRQLVLRGSTQGLCHQYRLVLLRGVRLLRCWLGGDGRRRRWWLGSEE